MSERHSSTASTLGGRPAPRRRTVPTGRTLELVPSDRERIYDTTLVRQDWAIYEARNARARLAYWREQDSQNRTEGWRPRALA